MLDIGPIDGDDPKMSLAPPFKRAETMHS